VIAAKILSDGSAEEEDPSPVAAPSGGGASRGGMSGVGREMVKEVAVVVQRDTTTRAARSRGRSM
jgi:hypothetical protein